MASKLLKMKEYLCCPLISSASKPEAQNPETSVLPFFSDFLNHLFLIKISQSNYEVVIQIYNLKLF